MTCPVVHQRFRKVRFGWTVETIRYDDQGRPEGMGVVPLPHARSWRGIQRKAADELGRIMDRPAPGAPACERFYDRAGRQVPAARQTSQAYAPLQPDGENSSGSLIA
jgi:hypothetical protein